jgi:hypothetical protein
MRFHIAASIGIHGLQLHSGSESLSRCLENDVRETGIDEDKLG